MNRRRAERMGRVAVPLLVTLLAVSLRMDALTTKYGTLDNPAWARLLTGPVAAAGRHLHPARLVWIPYAQPYVGGDPYNYLKFAREMRSFYQGHVREPVFLAATRAFLWLLSGRDVAVSFASALGSTLLVLAAYLLGAAAFSRWIGLVAALALAIDYQAIDWGVDGWRDDTFACAFTFAAWAFVRLRRTPSAGNAVLAGVLSAAACLTRITAFLFVIPGLVWLIVDSPRGDRTRRARAALVAALVAGLLVAPYLVNCARETGDPLIAIDYHTRFYRFAEGLPSDRSMSAFDYVASKMRRPIAALDTVSTGVLIWPLEAKGGGLDRWLRGLQPLFLLTSSLGLILLLGNAAGRLLLVLLLWSLMPYAFTWNLRGGGEWRFTLHAYPVYLLAASYAVEWVVRGLRATVDRLRGVRPWPSRRAIAWTLAVIACAAMAVVIRRQLPYYVVRESVKQGDPASILAGGRDRVFFASGWSDPVTEGNVAGRISVSERPVVLLPMPEARAYDLALRLDPVAPDAQASFAALLNGRMLGRMPFTWDPQRVGFYRVTVGPDFVRPGTNRLALVAEPMVGAASVRARYPFLGDYSHAGLRFWYVRIEPK